jgi:hypothetical protein
MIVIINTTYSSHDFSPLPQILTARQASHNHPTQPPMASEELKATQISKGFINLYSPSTPRAEIKLNYPRTLPGPEPTEWRQPSNSSWWDKRPRRSEFFAPITFGGLDDRVVRKRIESDPSGTLTKGQVWKDLKEKRARTLDDDEDTVRGSWELHK